MNMTPQGYGAQFGAASNENMGYFDADT